MRKQGRDNPPEGQAGSAPDGCGAPEPGFSFKFGVNDWPPPATVFFLSLQWLVLVAPGVLVLGGILARAGGLGPAGEAALIQRMFIISGLAQMAQIFLGHRLPAVVGTSTLMVVGMVAAMPSGSQALYGSLLAGGLALALMGFFRLGGWLRKLFTLPVLSATLLLVAVCITPKIRDLIFAAGGPGAAWGAPLVFCLALTLAMITAQQRSRGLLSSAVLFFGMVAGAFAYYLLGLAPAPAWPSLGAASLPAPFPHHLSFDPAVFLAVLLCYLALAANELGTVESVARVISAGDTKKTVNRALAVDGLAGALAGAGGAPGTVSYAFSPGMAVATRTASRWALLPTGVFMLALGVWPGLGRLFTLVPGPVVAAVLLAVMSSQVFAAVELFVSGSSGGRGRMGGVVVGAALMVGIVVSFMPHQAVAAMHPSLRPLLANGFAAGMGAALVMEHLILRGK